MSERECTIRRQLGWVDKKGGAKSDAPADVVTAQEEGEFVKLRRKNWARLIQKVWLDDPEVCDCCGEKMQIVSAITHPHQDDVIERILRSRGEWDPPWKRPPQARGPPRQLDLFADEGSQLPAVEEEDVNQDVPPTDSQS